MVNLFLDIETQSLDATRFIVGSVWKEGNKYPKTFYDPKKMWKYVLKEGRAAAKRKKSVNVYSHNAQFDASSYVPLSNKGLKIYCQRPFIWTWIENKKEIIHFLDTYSIFRMKLEKIGEMISVPKSPTPDKLKEEEDQIYSKEEMEEIIEYMHNDNKVAMIALKMLKDLMASEDVNLRRIYTINQIAIQFLIKMLQALEPEKTEHLFWRKDLGETRQTWRSVEIHKSLRGGRNQAFRVGKFKKVNYIDINSLYPYAATQFKCPDLRTERKLDEPLKKGKTIKEIISKIGLSRALVRNYDDNLGLLQIRTSKDTYFPKRGSYMIGTWTHEELQLALSTGYEILDIEWTITYEEAYNPFKEIFNNLYKRRKTAKTPMADYLYKSIMNSSLGKMAQHRINQEITIDSVEEAREYLARNYKIIKDHKDKYFYQKSNAPGIRKKYYAPIITSMIYAKARCIMYTHLQKIPKKDLVYMDTDSILFEGDYLKYFDIGEKMGQFKIEEKEAPCIVYSRKAYSIGNKIKVSGMNTSNMTIEEFEAGQVESKKQITLKSTNKIEDVGKFTTEKRDLKEQMLTHLQREELLSEHVLHIDYDIQSINHFYEKIADVLQ